MVLVLDKTIVNVQGQGELQVLVYKDTSDFTGKIINLSAYPTAGRVTFSHIGVSKEFTFDLQAHATSEDITIDHMYIGAKSHCLINFLNPVTGGYDKIKPSQRYFKVRTENNFYDSDLIFQ